MRLRTALMFADGNFVGREYYRVLCAAGRRPDLLVAVGAIAPRSVEREIERTGGKWNPAAIPANETVHRFARLSDPVLWKLIRDTGIDVAIQGGVGILKEEALAAPRIGILNVHPGRLPDYRGNSCPEWALLNGDPVCGTAHFVDEGIDTGPVICAREYVIEAGWDYADFRANLYGHCGWVLCEALAMIERAGPAEARAVAVAQSDTGARYHALMPTDKLELVKSGFPKRHSRSLA